MGRTVSIPELIEKQNVIIKEQADIIDGLFLLLLQYTTAEEISNEVEKINKAALLKKGVEEVCLQEGERWTESYKLQ